MAKNNQKAIITIDKKHDEMLEYFNNNDELIIPELKEKKQKYINDIKNLPKNDIDTYMDLKDNINEINKKIKEMKREKKKVFY